MDKKRSSKLKYLRLKYQIYILLICALILMLAVQVAYISGFSNLTIQRAEVTAAQLMERASKGIDETARQIENGAAVLTDNHFVQDILTAESPLRDVELYSNIVEVITNLKQVNSNIHSVFLLNNYTRRLSDPIYNDAGMTDGLLEKYPVRSENFAKPVFTSRIEGDRKSFYAYVAPVFRFNYKGGDGKKIGCCVLVLNMEEITSLLDVGDSPRNSLFMLLDQNNRIIASNGEWQDGDSFERVFWEDGDTSRIDDGLIYNDMRSIAQYQLIESTGWKVVSIMPIDELTKDMQRLLLLGCLLGGFFIVLLLVIGQLTSKNISEPIETIASFVENVTKTDDGTHQRLDIPYKNESGVIAEHINILLAKVAKMTKENFDQQKALYSAQLEEQRAQLLALRSQINPHFLYNTLNCLSSMGLAYDAEGIVTISNAMSDIFRYSIKGDSFVTVRQEIEIIKKYLTIMEIRYPGRFDWEIDIEEDILDCSILKMTLQPIVENSMYHGIEQILSHGHLTIRGRNQGDSELLFVVEDNGKGMTREALEALKLSIFDKERKLDDNSAIGMGLRNIFNRIQLEMGTQYVMDIESIENSGTRVSLRLPFAHYTMTDEEIMHE